MKKFVKCLNVIEPANQVVTMTAFHHRKRLFDSLHSSILQTTFSFFLEWENTCILISFSLKSVTEFSTSYVSHRLRKWLGAGQASDKPLLWQILTTPYDDVTMLQGHKEFWNGDLVTKTHQTNRCIVRTKMDKKICVFMPHRVDEQCVRDNHSMNRQRVFYHRVSASGHDEAGMTSPRKGTSHSAGRDVTVDLSEPPLAARATRNGHWINAARPRGTYGISVI